MEKIETKIIKTEEIIHHFYCDDCGDQLGSSYECDDGYYERFGTFDLKCYTPRGWYKLEKCLCPSCAQECVDAFCNTLEAMGFERD